MVEINATNSLCGVLWSTSALLVLFPYYSPVKLLLSLLSHLHLNVAMPLYFFPKPASLSTWSASNPQQVWCMSGSEEGAEEGNQHLCCEWSCWVSPRLINTRGSRSSLPVNHETSVTAGPGQSTATSSPHSGWGCWVLIEGINSSSNSFAFCDSHWLLDFFASVPATAVFLNASVFNFKDIVAEEALLPDDNLKITRILLVLLMLVIV